MIKGLCNCKLPNTKTVTGQNSNILFLLKLNSCCTQFKQTSGKVHPITGLAYIEHSHIQIYRQVRVSICPKPICFWTMKVHQITQRKLKQTQEEHTKSTKKNLAAQLRF